MSNYQHPQQGYPHQAPPARSGSGRCCLFGCLGCLGVVVLGAIIGGILVYFFGRIWIADLMKPVLVEAIKESGLPEDEQEVLIEQAEAVADGFRNGEISFEQLGGIMEEIAEGPLAPMFAVESFKNNNIARSGLPDAERQAANRIAERMQRGLSDRQVDPAEALNPLQSLSEQNVVTDEDIRQVIDQWKGVVETRGIPDEPYDVDFGEAIREAVERGKK